MNTLKILIDSNLRAHVTHRFKSGTAAYEMHATPRSRLVAAYADSVIRKLERNSTSVQEIRLGVREPSMWVPDRVRALACRLYDEFTKRLGAMAPEVKDFSVWLYDVEDAFGNPIYPVRSVPNPLGVHFARYTGIDSYGGPFQTGPIIKESPKPVVPVSREDFEKLEARVAALEPKRNPQLEAYRSVLIRPGQPIFWDESAPIDWSKTRDIWAAVRAEKADAIAQTRRTTASPEFKLQPEKDYRKMVLVLCSNGSAAFTFPGSEGDMAKWMHALPNAFMFAAAAKFCRENKVRELTLKRYNKISRMEILTKWLTGLVNEHAPVMKITSDPEFAG